MWIVKNHSVTYFYELRHLTGTANTRTKGKRVNQSNNLQSTDRVLPNLP